MTKRDFEAIAKIIKQVAVDLDCAVVTDRVAERIADYCLTTNPRFNRNRFLTACNPGHAND